MKLIDLTEHYPLVQDITPCDSSIELVESINEFGIVEAVEWKIVKSSAFKKGDKKHRNNKRYTTSFDTLMGFIQSQTQAPQSYPTEFNVHPIGKHKVYPKGILDAHLVGQQIVLLFDVDYTSNIIKLYNTGSHREVGI
jgi:mRNA-degrading endonuclease YafQ of YafQ-DinJ toxin-antitoxin module